MLSRKIFELWQLQADGTLFKLMAYIKQFDQFVTQSAYRGNLELILCSSLIVVRIYVINDQGWSE